MTDAVVNVDFSSILRELEADKDVQDAIREQQNEFDRSSRAIITTLNRVHSTPSLRVHNIVKETVPLFAETRKAVRALVELVPANEYYKWNDIWSFSLQRGAFASAFAFYLGTGRLITKDQVCLLLNIGLADSHRFQLSTEEYLHSLVSLINELSRLAVNSVTLGDFGTPLRLSAFVKDLHAGFQVLNLKNDSLRKRFDSIKYDVKKIEEVVYDISLRGLVKPGEGVDAEMNDEKVKMVLETLSGNE